MGSRVFNFLIMFLWHGSLQHPNFLTTLRLKMLERPFEIQLASISEVRKSQNKKDCLFSWCELYFSWIICLQSTSPLLLLVEVFQVFLLKMITRDKLSDKWNPRSIVQWYCIVSCYWQCLSFCLDWKIMLCAAMSSCCTSLSLIWSCWQWHFPPTSITSIRLLFIPCFVGLIIFWQQHI